MLTFAGSFSTRPQGSQATIVGADTATPSFVADQRGDYVVNLVVFDGSVSSPVDNVVVTAKALPGRTFDVGAEPRWVAVADLNADTLPDLVLAKGAVRVTV